MEVVILWHALQEVVDPEATIRVSIEVNGKRLGDGSRATHGGPDVDRTGLDDRLWPFVEGTCKGMIRCVNGQRSRHELDYGETGDFLDLSPVPDGSLRILLGNTQTGVSYGEFTCSPTALLAAIESFVGEVSPRVRGSERFSARCADILSGVRRALACS